MTKPTYEELAAQVEVLKNMLIHGYKLDLQIRGVDELNIPAFLLNFEKELPTPAACLAQVRVEAGRAGYVAACLSWMGLKSEEGMVFSDADRYAERIRQGGA